MFKAKHSALFEQVMAGVQQACWRHASQAGTGEERLPQAAAVAPSREASAPVPPVETLPLVPEGPTPHCAAPPSQSPIPGGCGDSF